MMLPSDRYLAELLGLSDEQYEFWREEVRLRAARGPQPAVVCGIDPVTLAIIQVVISVGLSLLASALTPRQNQGTPARLEASNQTGESQNSLQAFAPRVGFNSTQDVAALGEPIPVVYANRETIGGITYGGVRTNTTLLWSQILSLGGSQMLRAVFMLAEGRVASIDPNGFAIGDSSISSYDLGSSQANEIGSRITIYYRDNGGRISSANRILGRSAAADPGNAVNAGAADVFEVRSIGNAWRPDFCASYKPSTSTTFGVYSLIGNDLHFKLNPTVRPAVKANLIPEGTGGNARVVCDLENTVAVERAKQRANFSTRSGITSGTFAAVNDLVTYKLLRSSDFATVFKFSPIRTWVTSFQVTVDSASAANGITEGDLAASLSVGSLTIDDVNLTITVITDISVSGLKTTYQAKPEQSYTFTFDTIATCTELGIQQRATYSVTAAVGPGTPPDNVTITSPGGTAQTSPSRLTHVFVFNYVDTPVYSENGDDAASSISNRQKAWDDAIVVGELYKIGSALAVCVGRSPSNEIFRSDADLAIAGSGQSIDATFRIVRPGVAATTTESQLQTVGTNTSVTRQTATSGPHILRIAIASGSTSRECRVIELGFRSSLGIRYNGIMRFRTTLTHTDTDGRACIFSAIFNPVVPRGQTLKVDNFQSGTVVGSEERYSFFRVWYKKQSESTYTALAQVFGFAGVEQQAMFNYVRLQFPSQDSWEWELEPLSGWEIRNVLTDTTLYVIDSRLADVITVDTTTGGRTVRATFNGRTVSRTQSTFKLQQTERADIGLPHPDINNNYADAWGKLAEAFVYDEIQSSATQPEHEIVYINEIVENPTAPLYDGIALIGVNAASSFEWQQFSQLSNYVTGGTEVRRLLNSLSEGPSHLLPDLALDRLTNPKYGPRNIADDLINLANFQIAAQWCYDRRYFFDGGVIINQDSPRQWIADHAAFMLLDFREVNGRYDLVPQITFGVVSHAALFTAGNIAEGTFKFETIALEDRQPSQISVKWRQERSSSNPANPGMFPTEREVLVREAAPYGSDTMPIEAVDMSGFCTNENHAIDSAKFLLRMDRLRDHAISFETTYDGLEGITTGVGPGDMIRVAIDATVYDEFNNGIVTADGTVVSSQPLASGSYDVVSWGGSGAVNDAGTLTIANGIGSPAGIVFTIKRTTTTVRSYQITKISPTEDGAYRIEALHMPTDAAGRMLVAADWNSTGAWVIKR